jgi:hypothetical protein
VSFDLKWYRSRMEIAWGMERKWWFDGNEKRMRVVLHRRWRWITIVVGVS